MSFGDDLDRQRAQVMRLVRQASAGLGGRDACPQDGAARRWLRQPAAGPVRRRRRTSRSRGSTPTPLGCSGGPCRAPRGGAAVRAAAGTGRRGPGEMWTRFDAAVAALNRAITGSSAAGVADAFGDMARRRRAGRRGRARGRARPLEARWHRPGHAAESVRTVGAPAATADRSRGVAAAHAGLVTDRQRPHSDSRDRCPRCRVLGRLQDLPAAATSRPPLPEHPPARSRGEARRGDRRGIVRDGGGGAAGARRTADDASGADAPSRREGSGRTGRTGST